VTQLDRLRFRDFLRDSYQMEMPETNSELLQLLQNMNLAHEDGHLNLAGTLLFAEHPEWIKPAFIIKAVAYPGTEIDVDSYLDSEDFAGAMPRVFDDALAFLIRNLRKVQAKQGVNSLGQLEIPRIALEELLVNALLHRDYFISAAIRLFIFQDRIEIISPGSLPNHLTIAKIRAGNSNLRNPILASFIAKGLLPYRGLGSGIKRALEVWPAIDFEDDRDGCIFKAVIRREDVLRLPQGTPVETPVKTPEKILEVLRENPGLTLAEVASHTGKSLRAVERATAKMVKEGLLQFVGPKKGGHWQILE
jgi:ATP-dependent DNA helicase RecG